MASIRAAMAAAAVFMAGSLIVRRASGVYGVRARGCG
jgi:hypothetical protein